tara:strand:- start:696 stop:917 length:222 start_codon:yes stop_codon:yes gene_type:complete
MGCEPKAELMPKIHDLIPQLRKMKILTVILNILLLSIIMLSLVDGAWEGEDIWYLPLFLAAPAASLYLLLCKR